MTVAPRAMGDLDRGGSDAAGGTVDEQLGPGLDVERADDGLVCGESGQGEGGRLLPGEVGGFRGERVWLGCHLLGVAAVLVGDARADVADDLVAGLKSVTPMPTCSATSAGLTAAACTRTSTESTCILGGATSASSRTSGPA